jgi:hypothetical protein
MREHRNEASSGHTWLRVRGEGKAASELTVGEARRSSVDPLDDEFDRPVAGREIARVIARLLFDHEKRRAEQRARSGEMVEVEANR